MTRKFDYVIFDLGDTLMYHTSTWDSTRNDSIDVLCEHLVEKGILTDVETFKNLFSKRQVEYYQRRDFDLVEITSLDVFRSTLYEVGAPKINEAQMQEAMAVMYSVSQDRWEVEPDAVSTLETLKTDGYKLALISNASDSDDVQVLIDKAQIRPFLDTIIISSDMGLRKPHTRLFEQALRAWYAKPSQAVMVGDLLAADVAGAKAAGLASIWINRPASARKNEPYIGRFIPDREVKSLSEIPPILREWA